MRTLLEGAGAISQPCSLPVLTIGLVLVVLAGPARILISATYVITLSLVAWSRVTHLWAVDLSGPAAALAGLVLVGAVVVLTAARNRPLPAVAAGAAAMGGAVAAAGWQPCVGPRLAAIINAAPADRVDAVVPMTAYLIGLTLPLVVLACLSVAVPTVARSIERPVAYRSAVLGGLGLTVAMTTGLWDVWW